MENRNYKFLLYFIIFVILCTFGIQFYWNYKNYQDGKQQLINEVQSSLDNAIDSYFIDLADRNTIGISMKNGNVLQNPQVDSLFKKLDISGNGFEALNKIDPDKISKINVIKGSQLHRKETFFGSALDTTNDAMELASRIIVSITTDTLEIPVVNTYIKEQLAAKNIEVDYGFVFKSQLGDIQKFNVDIADQETLNTESKSAYLPENSNFEFYFTNATATILKRNLLGIFLSALLIFAVIGCLLFLLKIINRQKQLSELKNDLINNITHEFKTPISTVKVALEGINNFNKNNDPVKTRNYLQVSNEQLGKLEMMIEKLLETATLDGDKLQLNKEEVPVVQLLSDLVEKHKNLDENKIFRFSAEQINSNIVADPFHLENALNNILDNAVKYGGNEIAVLATSEKDNVKIIFSDTGNSLSKEQSIKIFEKFYRVPKGNIHDIKGFGIGLYYTKQIIEKHNGSISVTLNGTTNFIVKLPYE